MICFPHWQLASANPLWLCLPGFTVMNTHTEIHDQSKCALPEKVCMYRHAIMLYKPMSNDLCEDEFIQLNFQLNDNPRQTKLSFFKRQNYDVGKNILQNRMYLLNNKIDKSWLNLILKSCKVKCKELFLRWFSTKTETPMTNVLY